MNATELAEKIVDVCDAHMPSMRVSVIAEMLDAERQQAREEAAKVVERYWEVEKRHGATSQQRADDAANYAMSIRMGIGTREEKS